MNNDECFCCQLDGVIPEPPVKFLLSINPPGFYYRVCERHSKEYNDFINKYEVTKEVYEVCRVMNL
jgi:hypothetical protein